MIAQRHAAGDSLSMIGARLGRDKGTISRELRSNRSRNGYFPSKTQAKPFAACRGEPARR